MTIVAPVVGALVDIFVKRQYSNRENNMQKRQKKNLVRRAIEFIKLQLAGNILFWGTYLGYFVSDKVFHEPSIVALAIASLAAHCLFFVVSRDWVFDADGGKKSAQQIVRFMVFMGFNYFLNLGILYSLEHFYHISPYIGQFISSLFFTVWNYIGLKLWVFEPEHIKHPAITYHSPRKPAPRTVIDKRARRHGN